MNVLICDERRDIRQALLEALGVRTVGAVCTGDELLAWHAAVPSATVFAGDAPATLAAVEVLLARHPDAAVLVAVSTAIQPALPAGVRGCFALSSAGPGLCAALLALLGPDGRDSPDPEAGLTVRELEVLVGICRGRSNLEIGRELFLAEQTVKVHVRSLFRKLGVQHRAQAVAHGFRAGLIN